jgi:hypothetical protein
MRFCWLPDPPWLPRQRIPPRPDRTGSRRVRRAPAGPAGECVGPVGRRDEPRGGRQGPVSRQRHDFSTTTRSAPGTSCTRKMGSKVWPASATRACPCEGDAKVGGGICRLTADQQDKLKAWIGETLPRTTWQVGAWIQRECDVDYQSRSGLIALPHRLGMEHRKPKAISRKLDPAKQKAFIEAYNALPNQLSADEAVVFAPAFAAAGFAVHPAPRYAPSDAGRRKRWLSRRRRIACLRCKPLTAANSSRICPRSFRLLEA